MKKLLAMVGAVALGAFAWADDVATFTGTDFEAYTAGEATTQTEDNLYYWLKSADEAATATVVEGVSTGTAIGEWSNGEDQKVLAIKTNLTKPLYRSVLGGESALEALSGKSMSDVVYFDAMVKFTACDEPVEIAEGKLASDAQAKLAVWVLENVEDTETPTTNLYVTAGYWNGNEMVAQNYDCGPVSDYNITSLDAFQRLTIRTIADASDGAEIPGFVVFVNETKVTCTASRGDIAFGKEARAFNKNGNGVFPSIDITSGDAANICGVGFAGKGSVDDITFAKSDDSRDFAIPPKADEMVVTWTEGEVTALTLSHNDASVTADDVSTGSLSIEITDASKPVTIDATYADGKKAAYEWDAGVNCTVDATQSPAVATISGEWESGLDLSCAIKTMSDYAGATIAGRTYPTLEEAFAYLNGSLATSTDPVTIQLQNDLTLNADTGYVVVEDGTTADVTIDLNGKVLTGVAVDDGTGWSMPVIGLMGSGTVTIKDSVGEGKVVADDEVLPQDAVYATAGGLLVESGIFDGKVNVYGAEASVTGGSFEAATNSTEEEPAKFALWESVPDDKVASPKEGYWVVETPEVKTGSVIFVCEAAGVNVQVDDLKVGEVIPEDKIPGSTKSYLKITQWSEDLASWTVVEDTTTITGTADINLNKDADGAYQVTQVADLVTLKDYVADGNDCAGKTFKQTADITLTDPWDGIANFAGTYDGQNNKIAGVAFSDLYSETAAEANKYRGFFTKLSAATIKNLIIETSGFATTPATGEYGCAALVGQATDGACTFINVTTKGAISGGNHNVGGFAVKINEATLTSCTNEVNVTGNYTKGAGFVAFTQKSSGSGLTFTDCVNKGAVTCVHTKGSSGDNGFAGFVGWVNSPVEFVNCANVGAITTDDAFVQIASFCGCVSGASVTGTGCTVASTEIPTVVYYAQSSKPIVGLDYYDVDAAAFVANDALAAGKTYKVLVGGQAPAYEFAAAGTIAFNTNVCAVANFDGITVTDGSGLIVTPSEKDGIVTLTAAAPAPQGWPENPEDVKGQAAGDVYGETLPAALAKADAATVATWAKVAGNVAFADKANINTDAFLLNIDNASTPEQIQAAKDAFKITSFAQAGDGTWVVTLTDQKGGTIYAGGTYGNGMVVVESFSDVTCTTPATEGDQLFYKAKLVVKEVEPQPVQ